MAQQQDTVTTLRATGCHGCAHFVESVGLELCDPGSFYLNDFASRTYTNKYPINIEVTP
jgi:hypothetical protein